MDRPGDSNWSAGLEKEASELGRTVWDDLSLDAFEVRASCPPGQLRRAAGAVAWFPALLRALGLSCWVCSAGGPGG